MLCLSGVLLTINTVQTGSINTKCRHNHMEVQLLLDVITLAVKNSEGRPYLLQEGDKDNTELRIVM